MERRVILFCCFVSLLGLISVATGFGAEATKLTASDVVYIPVNNTCKSFTTSPALGLGLTSALTLLAAQIIMGCETGCLCCRRDPRPSNLIWAVAIILFIFSWLAFVFAFLILLGGAVVNASSTQNSYDKRNNSCFVLKTGIFAVGSILSFVSVFLMILHSLILNSGKNVNEAPAYRQGGDITMGQPRLPA